MGFLVYPIILLSGFTGLVYQITWQKYLSIYLGSHALSTSLTLSCFFLFLAAGYYALGKNGHLFGKNRLMTYAYIEALIGIFAIASPALFSWAYNIWPSFPSNTPQHILSSFGFALVMMAFPTFLMGGTIPILTQALSQKWKESHQVHAWVYGINTLGAFIGSLFSGFYLIETLGLTQTLNVTGMLNCLIFAVVLLTCKWSQQNYSGFTPTTQQTSNESYNKSLLIMAFLSGLVSFGVESLCIRISGYALGSSNYTYCIIVSAFIVSIALGSLLAGKLKDRKDFQWLLATQLGLSLSLLLLYLTFPHWPDLFMRARMAIASSMINFYIYWFVVFILIALTLLIPVTLMGATLPLLFQKLRSETQFLNKTAGAMYAINSLGATIGAIFAGYLLFFFFRLDQILMLIIFLSLINPFIIISKSEGYRKWGALIGICTLSIFALPQWSDKSFIPSRFTYTSPPPSHSLLKEMVNNLNNRNEYKNQFIFSEFDPNTYTVVTENSDGERAIYVNAKADADTKGDAKTRLLNAVIPLTLAEKTNDVFIIGLGAGLSSGAAVTFSEVQSVIVSEIAHGVIQALPYFKDWNFDIEKNKHKLRITNDDAYKVLQYQDQKFDLIFSEPSNTWVTGVEKLYTEEFLKIAASKLKKEGIYSQWFPLFSMTEDSFLSILKNFKSAFSNVTLWSTGGNAYLIIASHEPLNVNFEKMIAKGRKYKDIYKRANIEQVTDLLYHQVWSDSVISDLAKNSYLDHSLIYPSLALKSAKAFFAGRNVSLEELATKHFINNKKQYNDSPLVWQKYKNQLSQEFFEDGVNFFLQHTNNNFAAGRLTLTKAKLFDDWKTKKTKNKITQYLYLQDPHKKNIPKMTTKDDSTSILSELFSRFRTLKKMRETAHFSQVLRAAPAKCEKDSCYNTKANILFFDEKINENEFKEILRDLKKEETKNKLDQLFQDLIDQTNA